MAELIKENDYIEDDITLTGDFEDIELTQKFSPSRKSDALRRIEEYRRLKELRNQVKFFDDDLDSGDDYIPD